MATAFTLIAVLILLILPRRQKRRQKSKQSQRAKSANLRLAANSITIQVDKKLLQIAEQGLNHIIVLYMPGINSSLQNAMHKDIVQTFSSGQRAKSLEAKLSKRFSIESETACKLALESLSFLSAKYNQARYLDIGITRYRWSTSNDARVRPDHRALHGKIFSWDLPPIADKETGRRYHPGEGSGCRCIAIPLVE